ncbi:RNA polymerase sigma factor FliA [Deltaproteobacteria bacterium]|nr:RNA polymerase sigma factor FliA [Deltaproteobacteria bacterium]
MQVSLRTTSVGSPLDLSLDTDRPSRKRRLDPKVRNELIERHVGMVRRVAMRMAGRYPSCVDVDDLANMGMLGLIDAVDRFEEDRSISFTAYARIRVKGAIVDEMRRADWVPRSVRDRGDRIRVAREALMKDLGRAATEPEVAKYLGVSEARLRELGDNSLIHNVVSMEEGVDDEHTLGDAIAGDVSAPDAEVEASDFRMAVRDAIGSLPERDRMIVELYYFREHGFKEIGQLLGVTESRVSQLHTRIMERLRPKLEGVA